MTDALFDLEPATATPEPAPVRADGTRPCSCGCPDPEEDWCICGPVHNPGVPCTCGPNCWFCGMPTRDVIARWQERARRGLSPYHPGGPEGPPLNAPTPTNGDT